MRALLFQDTATFSSNQPSPQASLGCALVAPAYSAICRTDREIIKGYTQFQGVLGHEFVGRVVECADASWIGERVVGEINWPCGGCGWCREGGSSNHCPHRRALGIRNWDGAFADLLVMPTANLHRVPPSLNDRQAVFTEPLAAAFSLLESLRIQGGESVLGIGDGCLGLLIAQVLRSAHVDLSWCGHHESKLALLREWGIPTHPVGWSPARSWDIVVDASGTPGGLELALKAVKPRGCVALKTTTQQNRTFDLNDLVVRELRMVGSRCGPFEPALSALDSGRVQTEPLVSAILPLELGVEALRRAGQPGVLKVLLQH